MRLTVESYSRIKHETGRAPRVLLDGVDVTKGSFAADDVEGWVDSWARDAEGRITTDADGHAALVRRRGKVEIQLEERAL